MLPPLHSLLVEGEAVMPSEQLFSTSGGAVVAEDNFLKWSVFKNISRENI